MHKRRCMHSILQDALVREQQHLQHLIVCMSLLADLTGDQQQCVEDPECGAVFRVHTAGNRTRCNAM